MSIQADVVTFLSTTWSTILCFALISLYLIVYFNARPKKFPPGPSGIPILGVAPFVGWRPEKTFAGWRKHYGDVIGFKLGRHHTVVLNSYDAIQEALVKKAIAFNNRPDNFIFTDVMRKKGIAFSDYIPGYIIERKFAHTSVARLGFGKSMLEPAILDEAKHLIKSFGEGEKIEMNSEIKRNIMMATGNVVAQVVIGKRYESYDDPEFNEITEGFHEFFRTGSLAYQVAMVSPWLIHVPPFRRSATAIRRGLRAVSEIIRKKIEEHEKTLDEKNSRDFIDDYLIEMKRNGDNVNGLYSKTMLDCMIRDFFGAGMETVQSLIIFGVLLLANRPEMQKRIQDEIEDVIGSDGNPHYSHREKMVYCHAFLKEVMRCRTIGPLCIPHCTSENVKFRGYNLPKGTTILPNLYAIHNDPEYWKSPEKFNPERHIDADGKLDISKYLMPFGMGPRICIGRQLGEIEVFVYFVAILQKYNVVKSSAGDLFVNDDALNTGLTMCPPEDTPITLLRR